MKRVVFGLAIFLITFSIANAQVVISEVMYDIEGSDSGREWIEITNTSASSIDISGWKFLENETNHGLTLIAGSVNVPSGSSVIIVDNSDKFFIDNPSFSGTVFDSSFSLKNTGEQIAIRDADLNDIDSLTYDIELGAGGDGNTLQLISGSWSAATPTLGSTDVTVESSESESSEAQSSSSNSSSVNNFPTEQQIFADAGGDRNVVVGADNLFEGKSLGLQKQPLEGERYVWNFGNGETKEGQNVLHYYGYPGEYVVILSVSSGQYSASDRIVVNAYKAELVLSKVESDFVEVHNKSDQELNLSWWQLDSDGERFVIPKDTIVLSNKKLIFAKDITGLDTDIKENVSLLYPNGVEAVSFFQIVIPQKTVVTKKTVVEYKSVVVKEEEPIVEEQEEASKNITQAASVISSFSSQENESSIYKWLLAIFAVVGVSVGIMVYASGKGELGEDIEIVE
jgi:hypothetical protein